MKSFLSFICAVWFTAALSGQSITLSPAANRYMDIPSGQAPAPVTISRQHTAEIPRLVRASSANDPETGPCGFRDTHFDLATIDSRSTAGEIGVQHQVTSTGATVYIVPIEIIPGRNGTQPALSLVYNNMGGNGPLGYGWSIGGLSAITRTGKSPIMTVLQGRWILRLKDLSYWMACG